MRYIYLHGFASGPRSRKAQAFRTALELSGAELETPDLASDGFEHLTITGQLKVLGHTLALSPARLIGSSMGGYLAALYAATHPEVDRLVLLAPAFQFPARWSEVAGPDDMRTWRDSGWLEVYHYATEEMRRVHYGCMKTRSGTIPIPNFSSPR